MYFIANDYYEYCVLLLCPVGSPADMFATITQSLILVGNDHNNHKFIKMFSKSLCSKSLTNLLRTLLALLLTMSPVHATGSGFLLVDEVNLVFPAVSFESMECSYAIPYGSKQLNITSPNSISTIGFNLNRGNKKQDKYTE